MMLKLYQQPFMKITAMAQDVVRTSGAEVVVDYGYDWVFDLYIGGAN